MRSRSVSPGWALSSAVLTLALAACGRDAAAPEAPAAPQAAPAATATGPKAGSVGPSENALNAFGAVPEGKGRVVFYRPGTFVGMAIPCNIHEGDSKEDIARLGSGKYFIHDAEPGAHAYMVQSEAKDYLNMEVEAGETYFVSCTIGMGVMVGRPNLAPSNQAGFEVKAKGMKLWAPKPVKTASAKPAA